MKINNENIKSKVVIGFTLALSVVVFAIYLTYNSFTLLLSSVNVLAEPNAKLAKLQHTLADIATAESAIRAYTLTTEDKHFREYLDNLGNINSQLDSLCTLMQDNPAELAQIDSVSTLLLAQRKSLEEHVNKKKEQRGSNAYTDKALKQIASAATRQPATTTINQRTKTTISDRLAYNTDTVTTKPPQNENRKGLLNKLFGKRNESKQQEEPPQPIVVPQLNVKQEYSADTSKAAPTNMASIAKVRIVLKDVERELQKQQEAMVAKELALLQQDKQIMDQVRRMVYDLERYELQQASQNAAQAQEVAKETSLVLLLVGVFGLASGIAFILIILRDLSRSSRYKAELKRSRKEAIQLARAKEAFVANISHEIRTPLNVVLGFSEQLGHTQLQEQQQEHLQAIHGAGQHLLHIVNDVLDLSKLEAGKLYLHMAPFEMKQLLAEVERTFRLKASTKSIGFSCTMDEQLNGYLSGDSLRLRQVLFNLVDNAIKFTHDGEVRVSCRLKSQRRNRAVVLIEVSDTGIGIPMEQTAHVFGEFNQADDSIIRKYGGTGLGLSISKKLVEMQEGSLTLRSVPNEGTTFSIVLPMQRVAAPETEAIPHPQLSATNVLAGKAVLVIDDDAYSRTLCQLILGRKGMQVTLANDGQEALQLIKEKQFDIVLTDIQLPGMSGKAVARAIRKENPTIPIMALTANIMSSNKRFFAKTGISDHLLKPFTEQDLYLKLSKALSTQTIPEMAPEPAAPIEKEENAETAGIAGTQGIAESQVIPETEAKAQQTNESIPASYTLDELRAFVGDDQEALWEIVEVLVTDNRRSLAQLAVAAAALDWNQVGELAHKMRTAFRHLQAYAVLPSIDALEQVLHQPDLPTDNLPAIAKELQHEATLVLTALETELSKRKKTEEAAA
ncbi:ATP-binding protein [Pontibacter sp. HSC-36F09]|uniref:ATP-binding protein n=1 Tax=Pontibacter sp. HSC-36F09 TaxID=2910966 RepID=UPI0020A1B65E|nr:ATP-binding protein [Pontibacter sp. HSC-36F09]MCP2043128.1 signal transduction histidine kinase/DNA-binding response OmpR family regulator [Pontibacter sp. HSC-36F09]